MRLLVHAAGEADLLLDARDRDLIARAERIDARCRQITAALTHPDGPARVRHLFDTDAWPDGYPHTPAPSPLRGALATLGDTTDLDVIVIGTRQDPTHPLDTQAIADTLAAALTAGTAGPLGTVTTVTTHGLTETPVAAALTAHLAQAPRYEQVLVTWGTGAIALTMGALTALSQAAMPWRLLTTGTPHPYRILDPLARLDTDPVAAILVRWRMFAALDDLAAVLRLTPTQHDLVRAAAAQRRAGLEARDSAALRALLADAVVRRDGTAGLTVRRYITSRYEDLLTLDRTDHPHTPHLLDYADQLNGRSDLPLGRQKGALDKARSTSDPVVTDSVGLRSYQWLYSSTFEALQSIGKGSHTLTPPPAADARHVGEHLAAEQSDPGGWTHADLPEPPTAPPDTVLIVWVAGNQDDTARPTIGQRLIDHGLPDPIREHLDIAPIRLRPVVFGVPGNDDLSMRNAARDAERLRAAGHQTAVEAVDVDEPDLAAVQTAVETHLTRDTAALLVLPTGPKNVVLALLHAARRTGARHGLPLFVRQTADPPPGTDHVAVYRWPALTGGDLALLVAAREALRSLELDVAWRLLAASAVEPAVTDRARHLATAFTCRDPSRDDRWPEPDPAPHGGRAGRTTAMAVQRLLLTHEMLRHATTPADRLRLLVIAADVLESSVAASAPPPSGVGQAYRSFGKALKEAALDPARGPAARTLLVLNAARDRAPITHGSDTDPDAVVAAAADAVADDLAPALPSADLAALPRDLRTLLRQAVVAAADHEALGGPGRSDRLYQMHQHLDNDINQAIIRRTPAPGPSPARERPTGSR